MMVDGRLLVCQQLSARLTGDLMGTGGLMVKTHAFDLVSQGSSPTSVRAFFSLSLV